MLFKKTRDEDKHMDRLITSMESSWKTLDSFRQAAKKLTEETAGDMYGDRGGAKEVYVNLLQQMVTIYTRTIVSGEPRMKVSAPDYPERRPFAEKFSVNLNRHLREIRMAGVAEESFVAGLLGIGVIKTGLAQGDEEFEVDGEFYDPGKPFSEVVSINNLIIDMQSESIEKVDYIGDRFRMPKSWVREYFKIPKHEDVNNDNTMDGKFQAEEPISGADLDLDNALYEEAWIWEVYLPKEGKVLTWPSNMPERFKVRDWDGPEGGPYEVLDLVRLPNEVIPVAPTSGIYHLHQLVNRTMRKLSKQTGRQKEVTGYEGGHEEDATAVRDAEDGDIVRLNDPGSVQSLKFGGPDPQVHNMAIYGADVANRMAGNLNALGGLAPQSETFKQDAMLQETANALVEAFRTKMNRFLKKVIYKHAWYLWTEPIRSMRTVETRHINGIPLNFEFNFTPEEKEGDFLEYNFELDVYSMRQETPAEKAQKMLAMVNQFLLPNAELLMQSGYTPNAFEITRFLSENWELPIDTLLTTADPEMMPQKPGMVSAPQSLENHTVHERVSRPGSTPAGNDKNLMQANLGAEPQNDTAASTFAKAV